MLLSTLIVGILIMIFVSSFIIGLRILFSEDHHYNRNRLRTDHSSALRGQLKLPPEEGRDAWVKRGLAFDKKKRQWVPQSGLSQEAVLSVIGKRN
jgi:hypothetical protein